MERVVSGESSLSASNKPSAALSVIMSFCFNFDVPGQTTNTDNVDGNELQNSKTCNAAEAVSNVS